MKIAEDIYYVGVNDRKIDLFEDQYKVKNGISYNSYVIADDKVAVTDTVGEGFESEWLGNITAVLKNRAPDYLIIHHMEPDHSANIRRFLSVFPKATLVGSPMAFTMIKQFFGSDFDFNKKIIKDGDSLSLGKHELTFFTAPMVHWPEVIMTYDAFSKTFFSADAFGRFGAISPEEQSWDDEARRYYFGIVGKYGQQVQSVLKKISPLDIQIICPLHGPALSGDIKRRIGLYNVWSSYAIEKQGCIIAYTSVYGHTEKAAKLLSELLREKGCEVKVFDLARCDMSEAVAEAFSYGKLILASTTYNAGVFPPMHRFIEELTERGFGNRTVAIIENGTWMPQAAKVMRELLSEAKDIKYIQPVKILSSPSDENISQLKTMASELCES